MCSTDIDIYHIELPLVSDAETNSDVIVQPLSLPVIINPLLSLETCLVQAMSKSLDEIVDRIAGLDYWTHTNCL